MKRLNIKIERPNINKCFEDFHSQEEKFFYSLGSLKNVGYDAISNIVKERIENGEFKLFGRGSQADLRGCNLMLADTN